MRTYLSFSNDLSLNGKLLLVLETSGFFDALAGTVARFAFGLTAFCKAKGEEKRGIWRSQSSRVEKRGNAGRTLVELRLPLSLSLLLCPLKIPFDLRKPFLRFERFPHPLEGHKPDALFVGER